MRLYMVGLFGGAMPQINIYLDEDTARRMDEAAAVEGTSRSSWVREAIQLRLDPGPDEGYPRFDGDPLPAEVRQGQVATVVRKLRPVVRRQLELEALRMSSDVESLVAQAVEAFLLNAGRPLEDDPVAASWGALAMDPAEVVRILAEEDELLDS
jgi:Ribbon-helix-helix protein, copG family